MSCFSLSQKIHRNHPITVLLWLCLAHSIPFFPFKLIKKPKNGLLPSFSLDFTWNRQIWLFYTEKWIFFKHLGTLLKLTKLHFRPQSPLVSGSINICRPARWDAWINLDHYVGFNCSVRKHAKITLTLTLKTLTVFSTIKFFYLNLFSIKHWS